MLKFKIFGAVSLIIGMILEYQNYKLRGGMISKQDRSIFIEKHKDDETPYGLKKMKIYQDDEEFERYNKKLLLISELFQFAWIIILFLLKV